MQKLKTSSAMWRFAEETRLVSPLHEKAVGKDFFCSTTGIGRLDGKKFENFTGRLRKKGNIVSVLSGGK